MSPAPSRGFELERLFTIQESELPDPRRLPALADGVWNVSFFRANELLNLYTDAGALGVLESLGIDLSVALPATSDEALVDGMLEARGVASTRLDSGRWLVEKVAGSRLIERDSTGAHRRRDLPADFASIVRDAALTECSGLAAALDLIDRAVGAYPAFLRGELNGTEVLFTSDAVPLWEQFFSNENPIYRPINLLAAWAAREAIGAQAPESSVSVLEVGAGCGSGTVALLEQLGTKLDSVTLTDISPHFLRAARERVESCESPGSVTMSYRGLDLNRARETWRIESGSLDLIFAVNVLHAVRDLETVLGGLRELLRPGGAIVLGECTRPRRGSPLHPELIFGLLDDFRSAVLDPEFRPRWGFLDARGWRTVLERAGFEAVEVRPDIEKIAREYDAFSLAAIVARAPSAPLQARGPEA